MLITLFINPLSRSGFVPNTDVLLTAPYYVLTILTTTTQAEPTQISPAMEVPSQQFGMDLGQT